MTLSELKKHYDFEFIRDNESPFFTGGESLETFFLFFCDQRNIEQDVIPVLQHYLAGNPFPIDNDLTVGGGDIVEVTPTEVTFTNRVTFLIEQSLPLQDFLDISKEWANFLAMK